MKRMCAVVLCCGLMVCVAPGKTAAEVWEGVVTRVLDGDSFRIRRGQQLVTIRLYGIDSPEYGQACWREAKDGAAALLLRKQVNVEPVTTDRYGRIVALVGFRGQLINAEMVGRGLAWVYRHYCTAQPVCRRLESLEEIARSERRGIWREQRPVPPWVWKHRR